MRLLVASFLAVAVFLSTQAGIAKRELEQISKTPDGGLEPHVAINDDGGSWDADSSRDRVGQPDPVRALVETLKHDESARVRRYAAWVLGNRGPDAADAVPALVEALADADPGVAQYATAALVKLGPAAVPSLAAALPGDRYAGRHVETALVRIGPAAVPSLVRLLRDSSNASLRRSAARALGRIGPEASVAIPYLLRALRDSSEPADSLRYATALGSIGSKALPGLLEMLETGSTDKEFPLQALVLIGADAQDALPALVHTLRNDPSDRNRQAAALALGAMGPSAKGALAALLGALREDPNSTVRMYAASAVGEIGEEVERSVPVLIGAFGQHDPEVSSGAASALAAIGAAAIPALEQALHSDDAFIQTGAVEALGKIESDSERVAGLLIETLGHSDARLRTMAVETLCGMHVDVVPALRDAAERHPNAQVRGQAVLALGLIEPLPLQAVPTLIVALKDDSPRVRESACRSLAEHGSTAVAAVPTLIATLQSDDPVLRRNAAWALGSIGAAASPAQPALVRALEDEDPTVRDESATALEKIRGTHAGPYGTATTAAELGPSSDPRDILGRLFDATQGVRTLQYHVDVDAAGAAAGELPQVTGTVLLRRDEDDGWKFVDLFEATPTEGDASDPRRSKRLADYLALPRFPRPDSIGEISGPEVIEFQGAEEVDNEPCYTLHFSDSVRNEHVYALLSVIDSFPRRIEQFTLNEDGRVGVVRLKMTKWTARVH